MNRRSGVKMFPSLITAPIVLAHLIDFLIRRSYVNPPMFEYSSCKFDPHAYSRYEYVCANISALTCYSANTIGVVNVHILNTQSGLNGKLVSSYWPNFATLCLFVETMPIYKAVAT